MFVRLTKTQKVILYLIKKLGRLMEGRKKLMKLMFLIEYYDPELGKLKREPLLGNEFIIYHYGVFSFDVMDEYISLVSRKIISEYPMKIIHNIDLEDLEEDIKLRVDSIISLFGNKYASDLEEETLKMLGLSKEMKVKFFGMNVNEIIRE